MNSKTLELKKIHTIETKTKEGVQLDKIAVFETPSSNFSDGVRVKLQLVGDSEEISKCLSELGCVTSGQELVVILKGSNQKLLGDE